jgi:hypothetical protein
MRCVAWQSVDVGDSDGSVDLDVFSASGDASTDGDADAIVSHTALRCAALRCAALHCAALRSARIERE